MNIDNSRTIQKITLPYIKVLTKDIVQIKKLLKESKNEEIKKMYEELIYTKELYVDDSKKRSFWSRLHIAQILYGCEDVEEKHKKLIKNTTKFIPTMGTNEVIEDNTEIIQVHGRTNLGELESLIDIIDILSEEDNIDIKEYLIDLYENKVCKSMENVKEILRNYGIKFKVKVLEGYKNLITRKIQKAKFEVVLWLKKCYKREI